MTALKLYTTSWCTLISLLLSTGSLSTLFCIWSTTPLVTKLLRTPSPEPWPDVQPLLSSTPRNTAQLWQLPVSIVYDSAFPRDSFLNGLRLSWIKSRRRWNEQLLTSPTNSSRNSSAKAASLSYQPKLQWQNPWTPFSTNTTLKFTQSLLSSQPTCMLPPQQHEDLTSP